MEAELDAAAEQAADGMAAAPLQALARNPNRCPDHINGASAARIHGAEELEK
jgi:hypothetical protein